jgi:hypothetical protein
MSRTLTVLSLSLLFWNSACSASSIFSLTPTPTAYIYPTAETPEIPALTVEALGNAEYTLPGFDNALYAYQFVDGKFSRGSDSSASDYASLYLLDFYAFGDLNEDGVNDAAVIIAENYGGTGVFVSVNAVLNENGQPRHAASYMIDDRPQIKALDVRDGEIYLEAIVHAFDDPACCPEQAVTRTFQMSGTSLMLIHATSNLSNGQERAITIDSPFEGAEINGELVVTGSVTVSPFENSLTYRVYNEQGNELQMGPISVTASELGGPGTFTATLDTSTFPIGGRIRIVISDLSAADGSILALDSVMVVVR